jgi:hypothetical protein
MLEVRYQESCTHVLTKLYPRLPASLEFSGTRGLAVGTRWFGTCWCGSPPWSLPSQALHTPQASSRASPVALPFGRAAPSSFRFCAA